MTPFTLTVASALSSMKQSRCLPHDTLIKCLLLQFWLKYLYQQGLAMIQGKPESEATSPAAKAKSVVGSSTAREDEISELRACIEELTSVVQALSALTHSTEISTQLQECAQLQLDNLAHILDRLIVQCEPEAGASASP